MSIFVAHQLRYFAPDVHRGASIIASIFHRHCFFDFVFRSFLCFESWKYVSLNRSTTSKRYDLGKWRESYLTNNDVGNQPHCCFRWFAANKWIKERGRNGIVPKILILKIMILSLCFIFTTSCCFQSHTGHKPSKPKSPSTLASEGIEEGTAEPNERWELNWVEWNWMKGPDFDNPVALQKMSFFPNWKGIACWALCLLVIWLFAVVWLCFCLFLGSWFYLFFFTMGLGAVYLFFICFCLALCTGVYISLRRSWFVTWSVIWFFLVVCCCCYCCLCWCWLLWCCGLRGFVWFWLCQLLGVDVWSCGFGLVLWIWCCWCNPSLVCVAIGASCVFVCLFVCCCCWCICLSEISCFHL